ncbi:MAG: hypothetical protein KVP17_000698 [Porospora cf. gigantea B]|uniref:uncharacterized protein n=1 Tax=Porospora cf. gigantea B TaxID=2853592 RepID=UPI003571B936|nr:MAG: hypothetical protein KVP17_000698 [Porospora cf. gigantea B]
MISIDDLIRIKKLERQRRAVFGPLEPAVDLSRTQKFLKVNLGFRVKMIGTKWIVRWVTAQVRRRQRQQLVLLLETARVVGDGTRRAVEQLVGVLVRSFGRCVAAVQHSFAKNVLVAVERALSEERLEALRHQHEDQQRILQKEFRTQLQKQSHTLLRVMTDYLLSHQMAAFLSALRAGVDVMRRTVDRFNETTRRVAGVTERCQHKRLQEALRSLQQHSWRISQLQRLVELMRNAMTRKALSRLRLSSKSHILRGLQLLFSHKTSLLCLQAFWQLRLVRY